MLNKRKKTTRMRGTSSHGWGHKKKHRGKGHRGGMGNAGTGARADVKKPTILKLFGNTYFGKRGFTSIKKKKQNVLSLRYLENHFDKLVETGIIVKEGKEFVFDSTLFKYDKILGKTPFTKRLTIICHSISDSAKEKVEQAGGKVILSSEMKKE